jgi:glycerophosphoryl diester phosphodiesterase
MKQQFKLLLITVIVICGCQTLSRVAGKEEGLSLTVGLQRLADNPSEVWFCAHRGITYIGRKEGIPENSVPAIQKAIAVGAKMVEVDVQTTKDGHFVISHDDSVDRTTNGHGKIGDMTLTQIKQLNLRVGDKVTELKIPTLEEALLAGRGKVFFDMDRAYAVRDKRKLVNLVDSLQMLDQVLFKGDVKEFMEINERCHPFPNADIAGIEVWAKEYPQVRLIEMDSQSEGAAAIVEAANAKGIVCFCNHLWWGDADPNLVRNGDFSRFNEARQKKCQVIQTDNTELLLDYYLKYSK